MSINRGSLGLFAETHARIGTALLALLIAGSSVVGQERLVDHFPQAAESGCMPRESRLQPAGSLPRSDGVAEGIRLDRSRTQTQRSGGDAENERCKLRTSPTISVCRWHITVCRSLT